MQRPPFVELLQGGDEKEHERRRDNGAKREEKTGVDHGRYDLLFHRFTSAQEVGDLCEDLLEARAQGTVWGPQGRDAAVAAIVGSRPAPEPQTDDLDIDLESIELDDPAEAKSM